MCAAHACNLPRPVLRDYPCSDVLRYKRSRGFYYCPMASPRPSSAGKRIIMPRGYVLDTAAALLETAVSHYVILFSSQQLDSWFIKMNPKAEVPVLVHGSHVTCGTVNICKYINDKFDGPNLKPSEPRVDKFIGLHEAIDVNKLISGYYVKTNGGVVGPSVERPASRSAQKLRSSCLTARTGADCRVPIFADSDLCVGTFSWVEC